MSILNLVFLVLLQWPLVCKAAPLDQQPAAKQAPTTSLPSNLPGHWFNTENNATVGFIIHADQSCELYTERLTAARTSRACKVLFHRDAIYWVFLKGADGQCGASADFEFRYIESQQRLDLNTGGGVNFLLEKRNESLMPGNPR
ncbi:MAG: hypothetical protein RL497_2318 [Pseudomonadota bacterium]